MACGFRGKNEQWPCCVASVAWVVSETSCSSLSLHLLWTAWFSFPCLCLQPQAELSAPFSWPHAVGALQLCCMEVPIGSKMRSVGWSVLQRDRWGTQLLHHTPLGLLHPWRAAPGPGSLALSQRWLPCSISIFLPFSLSASRSLRAHAQVLAGICLLQFRSQEGQKRQLTSK